MKDNIEWAEGEIVAWEEDVAKGEMDNNILEKFKKEDEEKFKVIKIILHLHYY